MQRIVNIFYSHLVSDTLRGKRGSTVGMMAASGGAGAAGTVFEGIDAGERKRKTTGWGKIKMAVGDDNVNERAGVAAAAFGGAVSSLRGRLMMAKSKAEELVARDFQEEEEEEEEAVPAQWIEASEHPIYRKFFDMVKIVGEASVKKRMDSLGFDPTVIDEPDCMIGLDNSVYKDKRVPLNIVEDGLDNYVEEEHDIQDFDHNLVERIKEYDANKDSSSEDSFERDERENQELKRKLERFSVKDYD